VREQEGGGRLRPAARLDALEGEGAFAMLAGAREQETLGRQVVHCEIGEPEGTAARHVVEAGVRALFEGDARYGPPQGLASLREAIAESLAGRGLNVSPDRVVVTPGGKAALAVSLLLLVEAGAEVLVPDPGFPAFASLARLAGGRPVRYPLDASRGFALDPAAVGDRISPRTGLLVLNAPHNPTGGGASPESLTQVARVAAARGIAVVSDEVYSRITYGEPAASIAALPGMAERTVLVDSFSKTWSMSGWRLGYAVVPESLVEPATRLVTNLFSCTPPFVQRAGVAALRGPQRFLERMVSRLRVRRDRLVAGLNSVPGVRCGMPAGAFFAFPDVREPLRRTGLTSDGFSRLLLERHGVATLPGTAFGPAGEGYLRISYATTPAAIDRVVEALGRAAQEAREPCRLAK
jgi:aspartate/methionine/tyrosine aminotransferase